MEGRISQWILGVKWLTSLISVSISYSHVLFNILCSPSLPLELFQFFQIGEWWPAMFQDVPSIVTLNEIKIITGFKVGVVCCDHIQAPPCQLRSIMSLTKQRKCGLIIATYKYMGDARAQQ